MMNSKKREMGKSLHPDRAKNKKGNLGMTKNYKVITYSYNY